MKDVVNGEALQTGPDVGFWTIYCIKIQVQCYHCYRCVELRRLLIRAPAKERLRRHDLPRDG
jgi:NifB/MoaA-like Fe-S oxidoreductase